MSSIPAELKYSAEHEWITDAQAADTVRVGITDFAQDALGDVVYVEHPEVGKSVSAGDVVGEVESTKSVSDIYAPVSGEIVNVNADLDEDPGVINSDPYGTGWLFEVKVTGPDALSSLLSAEEYEKHVG